MNRIVMADGTEIEGGSISVSGDKQIMVSYPGEDLVAAVSDFDNPEKTKELTLYYSVYKAIYTGYTNLSSLSVDHRVHRVLLYMNGDNVSFSESYTVPEMYLPEEMRKENKNDSK